MRVICRSGSSDGIPIVLFRRAEKLQSEDVHVVKVLRTIKDRFSLNRGELKKLLSNTKRLLRQRKKLRVVEDLLCRVKLGPGKTEVLQLVVLEALKPRILASVHNIGQNVKLSMFR